MRQAPRLVAAIVALTIVAGGLLGTSAPAGGDARGAFKVADTPLPPAGPADPVVALTFDDGPHPDFTPQVLEILARYGVKATFFVLGVQAERHPDLVRRILAEGHVVANHTYRHPRLTRLDEAGFAAEVDRTQVILEDVTGTRPTCLRPPYGDSDPTVVARLAARGLTPVFWTADSTDFEKPGVAPIVQNALRGLGNGSIILMHDAGGDRSQTLAALPQVIEQVQARGLRFTPICQPDVNIPSGRIDETVGLRGRLRVTGWALDPNAVGPIDVAVLVDGVELSRLTADKQAPELATRGIATNHGFDVTVRATAGPHEVCVRAFNVEAGGSDPSIGCSVAEAISPVPFSIVEAVNRVRYLQIMRTVLLLDPPERVREAYATLWVVRLLA